MPSAENQKKAIENLIDHEISMICKHPDYYSEEEEQKALEYIKTLDDFLHGNGIC